MNEKRDPSLEKYEEMERQIKQWRQENPKATLTEIENVIDRELVEIKQTALEELVQEKVKGSAESYPCLKCQAAIDGNGFKKRRHCETTSTMNRARWLVGRTSRNVICRFKVFS